MVRQTTYQLQALRGGSVLSPVAEEAMGVTSDSGSCEEGVPNGRHPDVVGDSHDAYSHGVDDDPEEVHYVRGEDRGHVRPVCVPGHGVACGHARPVYVPGRGEVFGQDHPVFYHDHEACSCHCPASEPYCLCLKSSCDFGL